ncbi:hypothetical protein OQ279_12910, partial [Salinimicrobium sp. MT39]
YPIIFANIWPRCVGVIISTILHVYNLTRRQTFDFERVVYGLLVNTILVLVELVSLFLPG